jgi:hypothetical protein
MAFHFPSEAQVHIYTKFNGFFNSSKWINDKQRLLSVQFAKEGYLEDPARGVLVYGSEKSLSPKLWET